MNFIVICKKGVEQYRDMTITKAKHKPTNKIFVDVSQFEYTQFSV